jgi:hypothetical protein
MRGEEEGKRGRKKTCEQEMERCREEEGRRERGPVVAFEFDNNGNGNSAVYREGGRDRE